MQNQMYNYKQIKRPVNITVGSDLCTKK